MDFNACYDIMGLPDNKKYGRLVRKGVKSLWKATYQIVDENDQEKFIITEDNGWVKVWDSIVGEIPIIGMFTGYFLNPSYTARDLSGKEVFRLKKMPSFIGRRFQLDRLVDISDEDQSLIVLSFLMMVLLEKSRG